MLVELSIKHFAIIDELTIPFEKGLTVLTGETGAGKSIIIDAIGLLLGGRGSAEFVRHGEKRAEIEGLFSIENHHPVIRKAQELGIDVQDDMFVLRRDITAQGKSICRINGKLVTLGILREIGGGLVDIHGQHEHQALLQAEHHLGMLDSYAKSDLAQAKAEYKSIFERASALEKQVKHLSHNEQEMAQRIDLLTYQLKEINEAKLEPEEDRLLTEERFKLANSEKLFQSLNDSYGNLYGDGKGLDYLMNAMMHLEEAASVDKNLAPLHESISNCYYLIEESTFTIRDQVDGVEFDPNRLDFIESRLNDIQRLKRKYGENVEDILEYASKIEEELDTILHKDDRVLQLQQELDTAWHDLYVEGKAITDIRKKAAKHLTKAIHKQLKALYMEKTVMDIRIEPKPPTKSSPTIDGKQVAFGPEGMDQVEFYLSTNPGEPMKPLSKTASGGEISRIMLALKSIFQTHQQITSVIFDEVDTGVSGRVAQAIAERIHAIAMGSQVLCITHLPQVAAMADTHLYIAKHEKEDRVHTSVTPLELDEKVDEIARMISGVEVTDLTKQHARELLDLAEQLKEPH
ncbi:DNA repair and genetic recombination [Alkalihalophilus pseudofirmus OF4]|uniref:DNA repair protein RecN n=2 Tax=Alkalihalophilus pseudofirmus TaxID=79885 RepID=D3FUT8_ALKPO|nr:DNA repair protein RecN [Alkalihalophilus pseudofirmus]ADC48364.1 DNA repair and genetic recombination [Alkalihalophilus pseudofirmus OF4]MDV2885541.1 DNA repair protein RecN [Alkalihalophilus pseudofirmus]WEG15865.1 DNA repair protein RecN [Alkalihalophilus pseudofirmus]